jgi:hypothetical protein
MYLAKKTGNITSYLGVKYSDLTETYTISSRSLYTGYDQTGKVTYGK